MQWEMIKGMGKETRDDRLKNVSLQKGEMRGWLNNFQMPKKLCNKEGDQVHPEKKKWAGYSFEDLQGN